ncbi:hypothetical protein FTUN_4098 [Frigoriglobus tundricola]|uniref:Uncharacterized protein n=1 Tax=Frigoriglobus tundricola TaxID=2774151 RepID=A0A6M5YTE3_9BACT|nr:hypothetical protein FTUN_4098 [Frigoriglobus tundricola]
MIVGVLLSIPVGAITVAVIAESALELFEFLGRPRSRHD